MASAIDKLDSTVAAICAEGTTWTDSIVRWQDVHDGDLVILDDCLVVAERVDICQKPWGDGATFTAADIYHRLDNGHLVSSERHGDRLTAVRRPIAEVLKSWKA